MLFFLLVAALSGFITSPAFSQTLTTGDFRTRQAGTWNTLATWETYNGTVWVNATVIPGTGAAPLNISINHNVTVDIGLGNSGGNRIRNLYINSGTLEISSFAFRVNEQTVVLGGAFSDANNGGTDIFIGQITVNNTGTWNTTAVTTANSMRVYGNMANNNAAIGSFMVGSVRFANTVPQILSGTGPMVFNSVYISSGITLNNQNTSTVTVNTTLDTYDANTPVWLNANGSTLIYSGAADLFPTAGTLNASTAANTVIFANTGNQNVYSTTYHHLIIDGGGTKRLSGAIIVNGNLSITSGVVFDVDNANNYAITLYGNWNSQGIFQYRSGTVTFAGTSAQTITGSPDVTFYKLVTSGGGTKTFLSGNVSVINNLRLLQEILLPGHTSLF